MFKILINNSETLIIPEEQAIMPNVGQRVFKDRIETDQQSDRLMTMAFLSSDLETGEAHFVNAGHNHPMILRENTHKARAIPAAGSRLGSREVARFNVAKFLQLEPGDNLFTYTDGLIENEPNQEYNQAMRKLRQQLAFGGDIREMNTCIGDYFRASWPGQNLEDDVSNMLVRWKGPYSEQKKAG